MTKPVPTQDHQTIDIELEPGGSIFDAMEAATQMFLRMNESRGGSGKRRLVPMRLRLDCDRVELDAHHRQALELAPSCGYTTGQPFASPEEVRQFFTRSCIQAATGTVCTHSDEALAKMTEAVILTRRHCNF